MGAYFLGGIAGKRETEKNIKINKINILFMGCACTVLDSASYTYGILAHM